MADKKPEARPGNPDIERSIQLLIDQAQIFHTYPVTGSGSNPALLNFLRGALSDKGGGPERMMHVDKVTEQIVRGYLESGWSTSSEQVQAWVLVERAGAAATSKAIDDFIRGSNQRQRPTSPRRRWDQDGPPQ